MNVLLKTNHRHILNKLLTPLTEKDKVSFVKDENHTLVFMRDSTFKKIEAEIIKWNNQHHDDPDQQVFCFMLVSYWAKQPIIMNKWNYTYKKNH